MTLLFPNQNVQCVASGVGAGNNPAAVQSITIAVDNHAIIYVVQDPGHPQNITVVARGPLGTANLTVNAQDADGTALPPDTISFQVVVGLAIAIVVTVGTPAVDDITTPPIPAGW